MWSSAYNLYLSLSIMSLVKRRLINMNYTKHSGQLIYQSNYQISVVLRGTCYDSISQRSQTDPWKTASSYVGTLGRWVLTKVYIINGKRKVTGSYNDSFVPLDGISFYMHSKYDNNIHVCWKISKHVASHIFFFGGGQGIFGAKSTFWSATA